MKLVPISDKKFVPISDQKFVPISVLRKCEFLS